MGQPPSISNMSLVDNGGFCAMWVYIEPVDGVAGCNDIIMRYNVVRICNVANNIGMCLGLPTNGHFVPKL